MIAMTLREIARALGGEINGRQALVPGPGHSRLDRSLSIRLSPTAPGGFVCKSFADDDFAACRDFVGAALGLPSDFWRTRQQGGEPAPPMTYVPPRNSATQDDRAERIARARAIWDAAVDAHGTIAERYLQGRGLNLPEGAGALRFHPRTPWREDTGEVVRVPAMIGCLRAIDGDVITGVHKTRLTREGAKVGRKMQGVAGASAIKLDGDAEVTGGLAIGEGVETVLAARQLGFRPAWALASAGAVAAFPVLGGIEALTLLVENDPASDRAISQCAALWHVAGREVTVVTPNFGSDLADVIREVA